MPTSVFQLMYTPMTATINARAPITMPTISPAPSEDLVDDTECITEVAELDGVWSIERRLEEEVDAEVTSVKDFVSMEASCRILGEGKAVICQNAIQSRRGNSTYILLGSSGLLLTLKLCDKMIHSKRHR